MWRRWLVSLTLFCWWAGPALADCTGPAGVAGQFQTSGTNLIYCNGTAWTTIANASTNGTCTMDKAINFDTTGARLQYCTTTTQQVLKNDIALPFTQISEGTLHACGLRSDKSLWCWGLGNTGRLGNGATSGNVLNPLRIGTAQWTIVNGSNATTCGIQTNGSAWCWGDNGYGEIGNGGSADTSVPTLVSGGYTDWTKISSSVESSCGIRSGLAYCWGFNTYGGLGSAGGAAINNAYPTPAVVSGGFTDWTAVSVNQYHVCGLRGGQAYCWGYSYRGRLGNGASSLFVPSTTPGVVSGGFTDWSQIGTGGDSSCGLRAGLIYCWGYNSNNQLGDGTSSSRTTPTLVTGGYTDWTQMGVAAYTVCALRGGGRLFCWGNNANGTLGIGTSSGQSATPVEVTGSYTNWTGVFGGSVPCAIRGGAAYCWGAGDNYRLGNGSSSDQNVPTLVSGGYTDWTMARAGTTHGCGIRNGGHAYCWGYNTNGEIGDNTVTTRTTPVEVNGGFADWTYIAPSISDVNNYNGITCGIRNGGQMYCWGANENGGLGTGTATYADYGTPQLVAGGYTDWVSVSISESTTCGVRSSGLVMCWGSPGMSRLGIGQDTVGKNTPQLVLGGYTDWVDIKASENSTCGLRSNGRLYCWGYGASAKLGIGTNATPSAIFNPTEVAGGFTDWVQVTVSNNNTCGRRSNGTLYCWASNSQYQNGNSATTGYQTTPQLVSGGYTDWIDVAIAYTTSCGIRSNGRAYCWGYGTYDALGDGTTTRRATPGEVANGYTDYVQVVGSPDFHNNVFDSSNRSTVCTVRNGNANVYCWGTNDYGQQGTGTTNLTNPTPTPSVSLGETCTGAGTVRYDATRQRLVYCDGSKLRFLQASAEGGTGGGGGSGAGDGVGTAYNLTTVGSGTWTPNFTGTISVECIGGGAGGNSGYNSTANDTYFGGGGGGGYAMGSLNVTSGTAVAYTIGAGGVAGNNGYAGNSSMGGITGGGGQGYDPGADNGRAGGVGSGGTTNYNGGNGTTRGGGAAGPDGPGGYYGSCSANYCSDGGIGTTTSTAGTQWGTSPAYGSGTGGDQGGYGPGGDGGLYGGGGGGDTTHGNGAGAQGMCHLVRTS